MQYFYLILLLPILICAQIPDQNTQIKILYSMEYQKVPFKMRLFKKHLPTEFLEYHSILGLRNEIELNANMFGEKIINSTIMVISDSLSISWTKTHTIINDSVVDNQIVEKKIQPEKNITNKIQIGTNKKIILGYDCISFSVEDDSTNTEGFLASEIMGRDEFKNYGLPLEFTTKSKKENLLVVTKAEKIKIEPLDTSMFFFTK